MRAYNQLAFLLLLTILAMSCDGFQNHKAKEAAIEKLIKAQVAEKVEDFRKKRLEICRERVLTRASEMADSIVMATAINRTIVDSVPRPVPPPRPQRPPIKPPQDTTPVAPFFPLDTTQ